MPDKGEDNVVSPFNTRHARLQRLKRSPTDQSVDHTRQVIPTDMPTRVSSPHVRISTMIKEFRQAPPRPKQERKRLQALRGTAGTVQVQSAPAKGMQDTAAHIHQGDCGMQQRLDRLSSRPLQQIYNLDKKASRPSVHSASEDILQEWRRKRYQGKQVLQSSLQAAPCSEQPSTASITAGHSAAPLCATAAYEVKAPAACVTNCEEHLMASQSLPMQLLYGQKEQPYVLDQPASRVMAHLMLCPSSLASKAQPQHFFQPNNADAASGVKRKAVSAPAGTTVNRLSNAKSAGMSAGMSVSSLEARTHSIQPAALLPPTAELRGVTTDACKAQSTLRSLQLPPSAENIPFTERLATGPQATELSASTASCIEASGTASILTKPPAAATQAMEPLFAEGSACGLSERRRSPCENRETVPSQLSSIFGSPEASMSEERSQASVGADSDGIVTGSEPAQSLSCQSFFHQRSKADSPFEAFQATHAKLCLVTPPNQMEESTPEFGSACAPHSTASPPVATSAICLEHGVAVSGAQADGPPSGWTSSSALAASANAVDEVAAPTSPRREGLPVTCPLDAKCDMSWVAARTSASQGGESSSGRTSLSSSLASLLGDTVASALFMGGPMQTFPSCTKTNHLAPATRTQALTTSKPSEPSRAAKRHLHRGEDDPDAAGQESSESVRGTTATLGSAIPPGTSEQLSESVQRRLSEASQEASSPSAQGIVDSALPQLPPSTLNRSINAQQSELVYCQLSTVNRQAACSPSAHSVADSATDSVADGVTDSISSGSSASAAAWQHHSCNRAGQISQGGLAGQQHEVQRAGQGTLASAEDGLVNSCRSASACNIANIAFSQSSSITCSKISSTTSCSKASHSHSSSSSSSSEGSCWKGSSMTARSEGQANPAPSGGTVALSPSVECCNATLLCTDEAEDNKQLLTSLLPAGSKQKDPALAPSNESVIVDSSATDEVQTSPVRSSASADVQTSPATAQDTSDSIAGSSEALQTACSRAKHAESSLSASMSSTEAHPAQAGLAANATADAGHGDFKDVGQHEVLLGASEAQMSAEMHAHPPSQLITTSTGVRQAGESAQLGIVLIGHGVSIIDMLPEARVQAAATAGVCDVHAELTDTGVQTDASMLACKLQAETESCCSAPIGSVKVQADTQPAEPAASVSASDSGLLSGSAAKQEAVRHQSLPDGPAAESTHGVCASDDGLSSSGADAEGPAMHSNKAGGIDIIPGVPEQLCMSSVDANQTDDVCAQAGMQEMGQTDRVQCQNAHMESNTTDSQLSMAMLQAQSAMLGLVTACGGHDSLKEMIRADMNCFSYDTDPFVVSLVAKIRDTLTVDST